MPSPLPRRDHDAPLRPSPKGSALCSRDGGLPPIAVGSAPALQFSRPQWRLLMLRPVSSRSRYHDPLHRRPWRFVTSTTTPIATGWSESCRVGLAPTVRTAIRTAHCNAINRQLGARRLNSLQRSAQRATQCKQSAACRTAEFVATLSGKASGIPLGAWVWKKLPYCA